MPANDPGEGGFVLMHNPLPVPPMKRENIILAKNGQAQGCDLFLGEGVSPAREFNLGNDSDVPQCHVVFVPAVAECASEGDAAGP